MINQCWQYQPVNVQPTAGGPLTPTLIQQISSSTNPAGLGVTAKIFKFQLPNDIGAHNCLELDLAYPNGSTPTVTDSNGNTWPGSPNGGSADAGAGGYVAAKFVLGNANAGTTKVTVTFGSAINPVAYRLREWAGIDTVNPVNGTKSTGATPVTGPNLSVGSFTPGNNDANGGNVISCYFAPSAAVSGNPSSFTPGASFSLLEADITWVGNQGFPQASQFFIQTAVAAISPGMTAVAGTGSQVSYNGVAVALKASPGAGTAKPSGIHIDRIAHFSYPSSGPTSGSYTFQVSATGNYRAIMSAIGTSQITITSVTDSDGNTYTLKQAVGDNPYYWFKANTPPNSNFKITVNFTGGAAAGRTFRYFDISNAAVSPDDGVAGFGPTGVNSQSVVDNAPSIVPGTNVKGLCIASLGLGIGPVTDFDTGVPAGAVMDNVIDDSGSDNDQLDNADGVGHKYYSTNAQLNWNWKITVVASNTAYATAVCIKSA